MSFYFPVSTESLLSSAVNVLDWIVMLLPRQSFFFFFTSCFTFLFVPLLFHLPQRLLNSFTWNVLSLLLLLFYLISSAACRHHVLYSRFQKSISGFFLVFTFGKRLTRATLFFLSHQSFKSVAFRFRKELIVHTQTMIRGACELYIPYSPFTCGQKEGDCIKVALDKDLKVRCCEKSPFMFFSVCHLVTELSRKEESAGCYHRAKYSLSWRVFHH